MTRVNHVAGIAIAVLIVSSGGVAAAQHATKANCVDCDVTFHASATPDGSQLKASIGGIVLRKQLNRQGLRIHIASAEDVVEIAAGLNGTVTIERQGKVVNVRPDSALSDFETSVKALTNGSSALAGLERMALRLQGSRRPEAMSVLASFALVRALHGDPAGNALLAQQTDPRRGGGLLNVKQQTRAGDATVDACWSEYEGTLYRNHERYNRCLRDYWWNQPVQYACGLEFAMVAELALFRVIACSGGFPIG